MPRPIILTQEMKQKARKQFDIMLDKMKMSNGRIEYAENFGYKQSKAVVWLTSAAYNKTVALITEFTDEVAWHGSVNRCGEREFIIEDIFVYPQQVTGSTVTTDQDDYTNWLYGLHDDTFNKIRLQGHSHVNMGVSPSGVDDNHRSQILQQLESDMFYIFMIWNKSMSIHTLIYDMANNILYENKDVDVRLMTDDSVVEFIEDAKTKVKKGNTIVKKTKNHEPELTLLDCSD